MSELEAYKEAYRKVVEAIDNHYPDEPEFATLVVEAEELVSDYRVPLKQK